MTKKSYTGVCKRESNGVNGSDSVGKTDRGLYGLFSMSQLAKYRIGSSGFSLHRTVKPLRSVGYTRALIFSTSGLFASI